MTRYIDQTTHSRLFLVLHLIHLLPHHTNYYLYHILNAEPTDNAWLDGATRETLEDYIKNILPLKINNPKLKRFFSIQLMLIISCVVSELYLVFFNSYIHCFWRH